MRNLLASFSFTSTICFSTSIALSGCNCGGDPVGHHGVDAGPSDIHIGDEGEGEGSTETNDAGVVVTPHALYLAIGDDLPTAVAARVSTWVHGASALPVVDVAPNDAVPAMSAGSQALAFGHSTLRAAIVDDATVAAVPAEGYAMKSATLANGVVAIGVDGSDAHGAAYGSYALLEALGFAFFHPLAPTAPSAWPAVLPADASVNVTSSPRWRVRNIHLHTMHPLELTEMLNGWGAGDPNDDATFAARLPEWDSFLEWMIANGDNEVEWVLLEASSWSDFAQSDVRQQRLTKLVDAAHAFGVKAGIDVPIAEEQQHTFRLLTSIANTGDATADLASDAALIDARIDWLMAAGFDFVSTENGTTEFTHPDPTRMLGWMNEVAAHLDTAWGAKARIKAHCSTGQTADPLVDPDTGGSLNFNFMPKLADARMGVMPHTVQLYGIGDPAPTYGNTNFEYMADFLAEEVGTREVVWHPESAYWVSYDVDVPLFLPVYALKRVSDLRELARREDAGLLGRGAHAGEHMDGASEFSSGFEWGYWLNDVVAARASWNPHTEIANDDDALRAILAPLGTVLANDAIVDRIVDVADFEDHVLIHGEVNGVAPADIVRRSGIAYLQGVDAYDDLPDLAKDAGFAAPVTQPDKLGLVEMRNPLHAAPSFTGEIDGLVDEMRDQFGQLHTTFDATAPDASVAQQTQALWSDLDDALAVTALRARQVSGLYHYVDGQFDLDQTARLASLADARAALDTAQALVTSHLPSYRVEHDRIDGWRANPTAYDFTYLWTVKTLYYWWRDEGKAVDHPASPCYLNLVNPVDVAMGEGALADGASLLSELSNGGFLQDVGECLSPPSTEPTFPQDDLRSRP